jgi:predicted XRE-type DNA-binding protein
MKRNGKMRSNRNELRQTTIGTIGSENVFADLGLPDADNRLLKSRLVAKIDDVIEKRGLTQAEAGRVMGIPQPKVSELRNGRTNDYSVERLYRLLNNLGVGVSVVLEELPDWTKGEVAVREAESAPDTEREPSYSMGM